MEPKRSKSQTNWLDLPRDILIVIFIKIGVVDLLYNAQRVCSSWRAIAEDPEIYRVMDVCDPKRYFTDPASDSFVTMSLLAIRRSRGQLAEFSVGHLCRDAVLRGLAEAAPRLRSLGLAGCSHVSSTCLIEILSRLPLLEEVEICACKVSLEVVEAVGRCCPGLKSFCLQDRDDRVSIQEECNAEAFAVAANMNSALRSLHLFGNSMDNRGLATVLERFEGLEYLDIRQCYNLNLEGELLRRLRRVKTVMLPNDGDSDDSSEDEYEDERCLLGDECIDFEYVDDGFLDDDYDYGDNEYDDDE